MVDFGLKFLHIYEFILKYMTEMFSGLVIVFLLDLIQAFWTKLIHDKTIEIFKWEELS